jgi:hypothetical protein
VKTFQLGKALLSWTTTEEQHAATRRFEVSTPGDLWRRHGP